MKRYINSILSFLSVIVVFSIASCVDDLINVPNQNLSFSPVSYNEDGTLNVEIGIDVPEMTVANTRAMGDEPNFSDLGLYMLVFQGEDGLTQYARLSDKSTVKDEEHDNDGLVTFNARLEPTENKVVIHLIATDQPNFSEQIGSGMMESMVSALYTDEGHQAYWQKIDLGTNIPSREQAEPGFDTRPDADRGNVYSEDEYKKALAITAKLSHVPMVRNFVKVTAELSEIFNEKQTDASNYSVEGLFVINTIDRGTVAAYRASFKANDEFVRFFDYDKETKKYENYSYRKMTDDPDKKRPDGADYVDEDSQNYVGNLAPGVALVNTDVENEDNITSKNLTDRNKGFPVYFYERPAFPNATDRTYTVVKIKKTIGNESQDHYYKIDLGHVWDPYMSYPYMGIFEYYNLLRNFHYEIKINRIEGDGYPTLKEAANGAVFNNVSASVEAKGMKSISDGDDWIYVDRISYVFTEKGEVLHLLAQYREAINGDVKGGTIKNDLLQTPVLSDNDNFVEFKGKLEGEDSNAVDGYIQYTLACVDDPGPEFRTQEFYIYRGPLNEAPEQGNVEYGLYRIVTLYLHERFQFKHIDTFPGLWEDPNELPDFTWTDDFREVDASAGAPLTLFFELPPDLPMAVFPLEFVIESDRQNIQNAYQGNAVVRSVPAKESLFYDEQATSGNPTTSRIQYVKTVTWKDYNGDWGETWTPNGNKMVRCRFLTITDLAQDGIGTGNNNTATSTTTLRVYNEYFGTKLTDGDGNPTGEWLTYQEDGFKRDNASSDPTPHIWDFSNSNWNNILSNMGTGTPNTGRNKYTQNNNSTPDDAGVGKTKNLHLIEGGQGNNNRTMSTGTYNYTIKNGDEEETVSYRYIQTGNANDGFYFTYDYPKSEDREIRFDVMMTDTGDNVSETAVPQITGTNFQLDSTTPEIVDGTPFKKYSFTGKVPKANSSITVKVQPPASAPNARFYRIEFYPRWDELKPKPQPEETDETTP